MAWKRLKHVLLAGLTACGLTLTTTGEVKAAEPARTTPSLTERLQLVRGKLAEVEANFAAGKVKGLPNAVQRAWHNCWHNWGNWGNWDNCWHNWNNWGNWANHWCNH